MGNLLNSVIFQLYREDYLLQGAASLDELVGSLRSLACDGCEEQGSDQAPMSLADQKRKHFYRILQNYANSLKDPSINSAYITSIILLSKSADDIINQLPVRKKLEALSHLKNILKGTPTCNQEIINCQNTVKAITLLWTYEALQKERELRILDLCISSLIKLHPCNSLEHQAKSADKFIGRRCSSVACKAISDIVRSLLEWQWNEAHLNRIITALGNWLTSPYLALRERATRSLIQLLQMYKRQIPSEKPTIKHKGHLIGLLVPFCVHKEPAFRYWGQTATAWLLNMKFPAPATELSSTELANMGIDERQHRYISTIFKTATMIMKSLLHKDLLSFVQVILTTTLRDEIWSDAVRDVLKLVLLHRGHSLYEWLERVLLSMFHILRSSDDEEVKKAVRGFMATLVYVEPEKAVDTLLMCAYYDNCDIRTLWSCLAADASLHPKVLPCLLSKVPTMEELGKGIAFQLSNSLCAALWDFITVLKREELIKGKLESLLFYWFFYIPGASRERFTTGGLDSNTTCSPCSVAVEALKTILRIGKADAHILEAISEDHGWEMLIDAEEQHKGFASLGRAMRMCAMDGFPGRLIPHVFPFLFLENEAARKDYAAFFAEFIGRPFQKKDRAFLEKVFFALKVLLNDSNSVIRNCSIRGISNAAPNLPRKIRKKEKLVLKLCLNFPKDSYPDIGQ